MAGSLSSPSAHQHEAARNMGLLAGRGGEVAGIIRWPEQAGDLLAAGTEPVVCGLESAAGAEVAPG
ncbi:hypothetical protein ADK64_28405 [Streptomyces sp. MMG1121]|nr:hypothetical protein ADK64_28405 [Streptomyces sp. MMG1121]